MGRPTQIMLVDDDHLLTDAIKRFMERRGFAVACHGDGVTALADFHAARPDVVLLDVAMPGMDGWEVCSRIRAVSSVPIIMVTGRATQADIAKAMKAGADDYLIKPVHLTDLQARVERVASRRRVRDDALAAEAIPPHPAHAPAIRISLPA